MLYLRSWMRMRPGSTIIFERSAYVMTALSIADHKDDHERRSRQIWLLSVLLARRTPVGWLAQRYRLSPAETKLTEAIVNGAPLADAAEQLGIQLSTARTRLKIIQGKTGCSRQSELVRLAMSLPALGQD